MNVLSYKCRALIANNNGENFNKRFSAHYKIRYSLIQANNLFVPYRANYKGSDIV